ncbi:MAG: phosphoribosylaminoimidazolesuccinocarboxamide synthase [Planctomycetes bacterium]|nr:phosphoribosylaminoimidazolesuccinocarboxamide synthase [Planctomycetota bacterium]
MPEIYQIDDTGESLLPRGVMETNLPGLKMIARGKVRDIYDLDDRILLVTSDRISAYDSILGNPIPDKGVVLTQLSLFWFDRLAGILPHHFISEDLSELGLSRAVEEILKGRSMIVKKAEILPIECVVRGYLVGSGWREYQDRGTVCGLQLRADYKQAEKLDEPIFTPATKAENGHDENISFEGMIDRIGLENATQARDAALNLYNTAAEHALKQGIIIADTKFEFGFVDGELTLADEALTPDSSRFWAVENYETGRNPVSFDKQYVRDWLDNESGWNHEPPAPSLPPEVVNQTRAKYVEAYERITGQTFIR